MSISELNTSGKRLKYLREKTVLSQDEIAAKIGISQSAYSRYEKDQLKRFSRDVLERMAVVLNTTPEYILGTKEQIIQDSRLSHFPDYLMEFLMNPVSLPYIGEAFVKYQQDRVRKDTQKTPE